MAMRLDLKASFHSALEAPDFDGDPQEAQNAFEQLLLFLSERPPASWRHRDLDMFLRAKSPRNPEERRAYEATVDIISTLLDKAASRGLKLSLNQSASASKVAAPKQAPKAAAPAALQFRPSSRRRAKKVKEEIHTGPPSPGVAIVPTGHRQAKPALKEELPDQHKIEKLGSAGSSRYKIPQPQAIAKPKKASENTAHPPKANKNAQKPQGPDPAPPTQEKVRPEVKPDRHFGVRQRKPEGRLARLSAPSSAAPPEISPALAANPLLQSHQVNDSGEAFETTGLGHGLLQQTSYDLDGPKPQESQHVAPELPKKTPQKKGLDKALTEAQDFVLHKTSSPENQALPKTAQQEKPTLCNKGTPISGWQSSYTNGLLEDGTLLVDNRLTIGGQLPHPDDFFVRKEAKGLSPLEELLTSHRWVPYILGGALFLSMLTTFAHGGTGALFFFLTFVAAGLAGAITWKTHQHGSATPDVTTPERTTVEYLGSVRLSLFHRARSLMAVPKDTENVSVEELLQPNRAPLGFRFNTMMPVALKNYWRKESGRFEPKGTNLVQQLLKRYLSPYGVETELILQTQDKRAAVVSVRGREIDEYMLVPLVFLSGQWWIANGECIPHSSRLDLLSRLLTRLNTNQIEEQGFIERVRQANITSEHITRALRQGLIEEALAKKLLSV